jgi:hypothetical protein
MKLTIKFAVAAAAAALAISSFAADAPGALPVSYGPPSLSFVDSLNIPVAKARMSPELALQSYEKHAARQAQDLGEYQDTTVIKAELPDTSQQGTFRLRRIFSAPKTLTFKPEDFSGDRFVKNNVIARLLQSEVDHVLSGEADKTAISSANYKFSFKGTEEVNGVPVHVFAVKPRQKRPGLFKGKIYLEAHSGAIVRAEGELVKSPSFFIKKIQFVQDYQQVEGFSLIANIHSTAETRVVGKAVVDISHSDYQAHSLIVIQSNLDALAGLPPKSSNSR